MTSPFCGTEPVTNASWIQTFTGRTIDPLDPHPADVCIEDIAHALAMKTRFTGHGREFYSIAQHSMFVSSWAAAPGTDNALWGLLHDAAEAYLADVASPVKHHPSFQFFRAAEYRMMQAIIARFGLSPEQPVAVSQADRVALAVEARELMGPLKPGWGGPDLASYDIPELHIVPLTWRQAEHYFLERFRALAP